MEIAERAAQWRLGRDQSALLVDECSNVVKHWSAVLIAAAAALLSVVPASVDARSMANRGAILCRAHANFVTMLLENACFLNSFVSPFLPSTPLVSFAS